MVILISFIYTDSLLAFQCMSSDGVHAVVMTYLRQTATLSSHSQAPEE